MLDDIQSYLEDVEQSSQAKQRKNEQDKQKATEIRNAAMETLKRSNKFDIASEKSLLLPLLILYKFLKWWVLLSSESSSHSSVSADSDEEEQAGPSSKGKLQYTCICYFEWHVY